MSNSAGYNYNKNMSTAAEAAYEKGLKTLAECSDYFDLERETIENLFDVQERHHGKNYEMMDFFDPKEIEANRNKPFVVGLDKKYKKEKSVRKQFGNCYVELYNNEKGVLEKFDGVIATKINNTTSFASPAYPQIGENSGSAYSNYTELMYVLTGEDKKPLQPLFDQLEEMGVFMAIFPDGENYYGIDSGRSGYGSTRKNLAFEDLTLDLLEEHIFALHDTKKMKRALNNLIENGEVLLETGFYLGTGDKTKKKYSLEKEGMDILINPVLGNLKGRKLPPEMLLGKTGMIEKINKTLNSENYFTMLGVYFDKQKKDRKDLSDEELMRELLEELSPSFRVGSYFKYDKAKVLNTLMHTQKGLDWIKSDYKTLEVFSNAFQKDKDFQKHAINIMTNESISDGGKRGALGNKLKENGHGNCFINQNIHDLAKKYCKDYLSKNDLDNKISSLDISKKPQKKRNNYKSHGW